MTHHVGYTLMFEQALQVVDPSVSIPYWEYTIECTLVPSNPSTTFSCESRIDLYRSLRDKLNPSLGYVVELFVGASTIGAEVPVNANRRHFMVETGAIFRVS